MTNAEYHAHPALGSSNLKQILKNPYAFATGIKQEQTAAMALGSAVHTLVLEPHKFGEEFAVAPEYDARTKEGKEIKAAFEASCIGKTILKADEYERAKTCSEIAKQIAGRFFKGGVAESSFFSEFDGTAVKCRPDYYLEDLGIIVDVKTTADASPDGFIKSVANFGYYLQAAFYMDVLQSLGKNADKFMFVAIETKEPFMVGLYTLDSVSIDFGRSEYKRALEIYGRIDDFRSPVYKDTTTGEAVQTLTLPNWCFYKNGASY